MATVDFTQQDSVTIRLERLIAFVLCVLGPTLAMPEARGLSDLKVLSSFSQESLAPGIQFRSELWPMHAGIDPNGLPTEERATFLSPLEAQANLFNESMGVCACTKVGRFEPNRPIGQISLRDVNGRRFAVSVVSFDFALRMFQEMARRKAHPTLALLDGCYARAHEMSYVLERRGVLTGKIMVTGHFRILSSRLLTGSVAWGFHVAPIVVIDESGQRKIWVLDPALFSEPVPVQTWLALLMQNSKAKLSEAYLTSRFVFHPKHKDLNLTRWRSADLHSAQDIMDGMRSRTFTSRSDHNDDENGLTLDD